VCCYAGLIFYFSSQSEFPHRLPPFLEELGDKAHHMVEYGVFGVLWYRAFRFGGGRWSAVRAVVLAIVASALYGVTDEVHQYFVPMRQADVWDVAADAAGATVAALSCEWWFTRQAMSPTA
jgi:VanZ family protein